MNLFVILAGLVFLGIAVATLVAIIGVLCGIKKRPGRATLLRLGLCPLPLVACFAAVSWVFGPADYDSPQDLIAAYQTEFGELPPGDVSDLEARQIAVGDSGAAWLRFRASSATIDRLLSRFAVSDQATFSQGADGANAPSWWTPDSDKIELFYTADGWSKDWSHSTAYVGVDRDKGILYFHHSGVD
jgi:hypothetical protein